MTAPTVSDAPDTAPAPAGEQRQAFSVDERHQFHQEDRRAAGMVAGLMLVIFIVALMMYTYIAFCAAFD